MSQFAFVAPECQCRIPRGESRILSHCAWAVGIPTDRLLLGLLSRRRRKILACSKGASFPESQGIFGSLRYPTLPPVPTFLPPLPPPLALSLSRPQLAQVLALYFRYLSFISHSRRMAHGNSFPCSHPHGSIWTLRPTFPVQPLFAHLRLGQLVCGIGVRNCKSYTILLL